MTSVRSAPPPITLTSSDEVVAKEDIHKHRRRFIGPMPASAVLPPEKSKGGKRKTFLRAREESSSSSSDSDDSSSLSDVIHRHALDFFLKHGGKREDWGQSQAKSVRAEMRRRWRESDWGRARKQRRQAGTGSKWVGNSFDVGVFLGVDILDENLASVTPAQASTSHGSERPSIANTPASPSAGADTFVTAQSHLSTPAREQPGPATLSLNVSQDRDSVWPGSASSSTALLAPSASHHGPVVEQQHTNGASTSARPTNGDAQPLRPANQGRKSTGKGMHVHYEETPAVPPSEVLARRGSAVEDTSAGAAEQATAENQVKWGDVIMRGERNGVMHVCRH